MFLALFCDCTSRFTSDLGGKPEDLFSHVDAQIVKLVSRYLRAEDRENFKYLLFCYLCKDVNFPNFYMKIFILFENQKH